MTQKQQIFKKKGSTIWLLGGLAALAVFVAPFIFIGRDNLPNTSYLSLAQLLFLVAMASGAYAAWKDDAVFTKWLFYIVAFVLILVYIAGLLLGSDTAQGFLERSQIRAQQSLEGQSIQSLLEDEETASQRPLTAEEQAALSEQMVRDRANEARAREAEARALAEPRVTLGCTGAGAQYNVFRDCRTVFFPTTAPYQTPNVSNGCLLAHDALVTAETVGTGTELFTPVRAGITVYFFVAEFEQVFRVNDTVCTPEGLQPRS